MSDKKKISEAPALTPDMKKLMQTHASHDAWKNRPTSKPQATPTLTKKDPSEFDPNAFKNTGPKSDLKLAGESGSACGNVAGMQAAPLTDEQRRIAIRELIRNRVREVVRKKAGGGGYQLYAPNKGKKGKARPVGSFPTKLGAKRAELSRFPPKDAGKLKRLRREVDRLIKNPKKAAEREKNAMKLKGTAKTPSLSTKSESKLRESPFQPTGTTSTTSTVTSTGTTPSTTPKINPDPRAFMTGLKAIPTTDKIKRTDYIQKHLASPEFIGSVKKQKDGDKIVKQLYAMADGTYGASMVAGKSKASDGTTTALTGESLARRSDFMERRILSTIVKKSLSEALFREEKAESEWDDYISKLSKQALAGDNKFQNLQKNIVRKSEGILEDALYTIKKALGKGVKVNSFGVKQNGQNGKTYLAFSVDFEDLTVEPIYIYIENGVPKIEISSPAKVALTKAEPSDAKAFRAELLTVQERVLDEMDSLSKAIDSRDKYLKKLEAEVDGYVAGLTTLQISLLKNLLVKKYRKSS